MNKDLAPIFARSGAIVQDIESAGNIYQFSISQTLSTDDIARDESSSLRGWICETAQIYGNKVTRDDNERVSRYLKLHTDNCELIVV